MNQKFIPVLEKVEEDYVEWGQFVDLDKTDNNINNNNNTIPKKKYKKRIIETYVYPYLDEECIEEKQNNEEQIQENQEKQTIFSISIPFTRKKMRIHLEKPKLFSYFSFTMISITALVTITFYL